MTHSFAPILASLFALALASGCGHAKKAAENAAPPVQTPPAGKPPAVANPATGKIGGSAWTFMSGRATDGFSAAEVDLEFYGADVVDQQSGLAAGVCDPGNDPKDHRLIMVGSLPRKAGTVPMGATDSSGHTGTFVYPDDKSQPVNMATDKGQVVIEEVTDQTIKGTVTLKFDDSNFVDGAFIVTVCKN